MKVTLVIDGERREVEVDLARGIARVEGVDRPARIVATSATSVELEIDGERVQVDGWSSDTPVPTGPITVDGERYRVSVEVGGPAERAPAMAGTPRIAPVAGGAAEAGGADAIRPPMPGRVIEVRVKEGDRVRRGTVLLVLEAMKMRNEVTAPKDGVVRDLRVAPGDSVKAREPMLSVVAEAPP